MVHKEKLYFSIMGSRAFFVCTKIYHPSGNPTPSPQDIQFTKRMEECGEMMGIQLLDHIIVGDSGYISLREENFFASE